MGRAASVKNLGGIEATVARAMMVVLRYGEEFSHIYAFNDALAEVVWGGELDYSQLTPAQQKMILRVQRMMVREGIMHKYQDHARKSKWFISPGYPAGDKTSMAKYNSFRKWLDSNPGWGVEDENGDTSKMLKFDSHFYPAIQFFSRMEEEGVELVQFDKDHKVDRGLMESLLSYDEGTIVIIRNQRKKLLKNAMWGTDL